MTRWARVLVVDDGPEFVDVLQEDLSERASRRTVQHSAIALPPDFLSNMMPTTMGLMREAQKATRTALSSRVRQRQPDICPIVI